VSALLRAKSIIQSGYFNRTDADHCFHFMTFLLSLTDSRHYNRIMLQLNKPSVSSSTSDKAYVLIAQTLGFVSVEDMLSGTGLTEETLSELEYLSITDTIAIVNNVHAHTNDPNWAATLGGHLGVTSHGPVGYATLSAPTLGKALATFVEWEQLRSGTYTGSIIETDESFEIVINDTSLDTVFQEFFFEALMRALEVLVTLILGKSPGAEMVLHFKTDAANRKALMLKMYDSQLCFGTDVNKLVVPKRYWFAPSPLADQDSYELNLEKCRRLLAKKQHSNRIDLLVRQIIYHHFEAVRAGDATSAPPTQAVICKRLHMTERTLIRQLGAVNNSYKRILETERQRLAEQLLADARYTIFNISEILGYKESANFCRAFRRWFGQSPSSYRRNLR